MSDRTSQRAPLGRTSYYWLNTWVMANIIQLATQDFCVTFLGRANDPCGRQYDQMVQAARSGVANIVEGNSRHDTSKETEMKLVDVARASIAELQSDCFNWILAHGGLPWSDQSADFLRLNNLRLESPAYKDDVTYESAKHILREKQKFAPWLASEDSLVRANAILILCNRLILMINKQLNALMGEFRTTGGFTERLTAERLEARSKKSVEVGAPRCPNCGKPMLKRTAKKGINSGKQFWSCSAYPNCTGTRQLNEPS